MSSQLSPPYPAPTHADSRARKGRENRADIARVMVALGLLALLASFDEPKDAGLVAAAAPASGDAGSP